MHGIADSALPLTERQCRTAKSGPYLCVNTLDSEHEPHADADAECRNAALAGAPLELMHQCHGDARARHAKRVIESDATTIGRFIPKNAPPAMCLSQQAYDRRVDFCGWPAPPIVDQPP